MYKKKKKPKVPTTTDDMPGPSGELPFKRQKKEETLSESDEEPYIDDPSESDTDYCESVLSDREDGNCSASKWNYSDLKQLKIFFDEKPEIYEDFMMEVKEDILRKHPHCPDFSKCVNTFTHLLKENVVFSYDLESIREFRKHMYKNKVAIEQEMIKDIQGDVEKSENAENNLDLMDMLSRRWFPAVQRFAYQTLKLIKRSLYPMEEGTGAPRMCVDPSNQKQGEQVECAGVCEAVDKEFFHHFCSIFGQLFFLEPDAVNRKTFYFNGKTVNSTPDLAYSLHLEPSAGLTDVQDTILFVSEVKRRPVRMKTSVPLSLEEQVGPGVLGQVGSELFAETNFSLLKPNSLGIICMETRFIFVYLRMPEAHFRNVLLGKPLETKGKISYTRSFDMLNAEDRSKIAEFLYFLGCVQNS